jgi:hypothetical protein
MGLLLLSLNHFLITTRPTVFFLLFIRYDAASREGIPDRKGQKGCGRQESKTTSGQKTINQAQLSNFISPSLHLPNNKPLWNKLLTEK